MSSILIALTSAVCIFFGALLGIGLQRILPVKHLNKESQDVVKLSAGTIATLTALVLGLLVSSAKSTFDTMNNGFVQGSAKIILLDRTLARYGPETKAAREQLKRSLVAVIEMIWPTEKTGVSASTGFDRSNGMELVQEKLDELTPQNDFQRQVLARAQQIASDISQARWLLVAQEQTQLTPALLIILVFWLALLFVSFGLFSPPNPTTITVLFVGACAISAAIFLVLELSKPLGGFIEISSGPFRNALRHISQ